MNLLGGRIYGAIAALWITLCAACGGGGSGSSGGDRGASDPEVIARRVSVVLDSEVPLQARQRAGHPADAVIMLHATGELQLLQGQTVYFYVETPEEGLFLPTPELRLSGEYATIIVRTDPAAWAHEAHYQNTLRLFVCLDPACASQFAGSPLSVPYDFQVTPPLSVSASSVNLRTTFGTPRASTELTVSLPEGATEWFVYSGDDIARNVGGRLVIQPPLYDPPGTFSRQVVVAAQVHFPDGSMELDTRVVDVDYSIEPSAVPFVLTPMRMEFVLPWTDSMGMSARVTRASGRADAGFYEIGVRYDSAPAAAAGHPNLNHWLYAGLDPMVRPCSYSGSPAACLPPGTYEATMSFEFRDFAGTFAIPVDVTVVMTLTP